MTTQDGLLFPPPVCQCTQVFSLQNNQQIRISSQFDSGNIQVIRQISQFQYQLSAGTDNQNSEYRMNSKSWFYFSVQAPLNSKCTFIIQKVQCLLQLIQGKFGNVYRPVVKHNKKWQRLKTECKLNLKSDQKVQISFSYCFKQQSKVYFAFCYPFTYQENLEYIESLNCYTRNQNLYYHCEEIIRSPQNRKVHLLTITSHSHSLNQLEPKFNQNLFPENNRPIKFQKPVVLITARVHPGQTPASYSMIGIINFLVSNDLRAIILREMFVFFIVPMINVDGVYRGNFRMDVFGHNLNRHYIEPDLEKQSAVYAIKKLAENLHENKRLSFYFDLHAHNAKKGCFIYGNAIDNFVDQVQSNTFCKLVSINTKFFEYDECTFSTKHMKSKDKYDDFTKQGCARVVMHRLTGIIHSYSLECGLISSNILNQLPEVSNKDFQHNSHGYIEDDLQTNSNPMFSGDPPLYTQEMYQNVGKALMVSILDTFSKNPYSRIPSSNFNAISILRRFIAFQIFHQAQRFRMFEKHTFLKVKKINSLMEDNFKTKFHLHILQIQQTQKLKHIRWPNNIQGLQKQTIIKRINPSPTKNFKNISNFQKYGSMPPLKNESKIDCGLSQQQLKQQQLMSKVLESYIQPSQYQSQFRQTNPLQDIKNTQLPAVCSEPQVLQQAESPLISKQINKRQLRNKIKNSIRQQLKIQLFDQSYPFGDKTIRVDAHNSYQLPSNLIFTKQRNYSNVIHLMRERRNSNHKTRKIRNSSKIEKQKEIHSADQINNLNRNLNKLCKEIQTSIDQIDFNSKKNENNLQICVSDSIIPVNFKSEYSISKLPLNTSPNKKEVKLPKINNTIRKSIQVQKSFQLNTVQMGLIDYPQKFRSQEFCKNLSDIREKGHAKLFNRLKRLNR